MLASVRRKTQKPVDRNLPAIMLMLLMLGMLTLFSATYYKAQDGGDPFSEVKKQLFGAAVGFAAMAVTARVPYSFWGKRKVVVTGIAFLMIIGCEFFINYKIIFRSRSPKQETASKAPEREPALPEAEAPQAAPAPAQEMPKTVPAAPPAPSRKV